MLRILGLFEKRSGARAANEISRIRGAGLCFETWSADRGSIGNSRNPAYAHVMDNSNGKELARIAIVKNPPKKPEDVIYHPADKGSELLSQAIVKFAAMPSEFNKVTKTNFTNWQSVLFAWVSDH